MAQKNLLFPKAINPQHLEAIIDLHFYCVDLETDETDYIKLMQNLEPHLCKNGKQLGNPGPKDDRFRVVVVCDSKKSGKFMLLVSINHTLADGATFYNICEVFTREVSSLDPERLGSVKFRQVQDSTIGSISRKLAGNGWLIANMVGSIIGDAFRGKKREILLCQVYKEYIVSQKQHVDGVAYVSTNDILTSLVLGSQVFGADIGLFEVDLRERVEGCVANKVGNYSFLVPVCSADISTPSLVRKTFIESPFGLKRAVTDGQPFRRFFKTKCTAVSNWSSLRRNIDLLDCERYLHLPMMNILGPSPFAGCLIFKPTDEEIGLLLINSKYDRIPKDHDARGKPFLEMPKIMRK